MDIGSAATETWQIFSLIGLLLIIAEMFSGTFVLLPLGIGFLGAALLSNFTESTNQDLLALSAVQFLVILYLLKKKKVKTSAKSGMDALIGKTALVTEAIDNNGKGYVKVYGDSWVAVSKSKTEHSVNAEVKVLAFEGNKLIVE